MARPARLSLVPTPPPVPPSADSEGLVLGADRPDDAVVFDRAVVDFFVSGADMLGVPKSVAAIYGIVFASPEPLCFADIEARLDISVGSISQGVRVLRNVGALKVVGCNGGRREFFAPDMEMRNLIRRWLEEHLQKQLSAGGSRLAVLNRMIPVSDRSRQEELRLRLKQLKAWHDKARALLPLAKTFLALSP